MSYTRWSKDSSVYVYLDSGGYFSCCQCARAGWKHQWTKDILKHLMEHRQAGDKVPDECFNSLRRDREGNDAWIRRRLGLRKKRGRD